MAKPLVIGIGNLHAGDDAAGRLVAQAMGGAVGFDVIESHGAAADIVTYFEGRQHVALVDACRSGAPIGTIHQMNAHTDTLPGWLNSVSSHGIGVAEAVDLARVLDQLPQRVDILAIEGADFTVGAEMAPEVAAAVETCAERIRALFR